MRNGLLHIISLFIVFCWSLFFAQCSYNEPVLKIDYVAYDSIPTYPATATLPKDIKWQTNDEDPVVSSSKAKKGDVLKTYLPSYPLTFRLFGPNSNDYFAFWSGLSCSNYSLVNRHPYTLNPVPELATHWAVLDDQKTIYYKLDPDVRYNDGRPLTADDYIFGYKMMMSSQIKDPYMNKYYKERFSSVEKVDDYTLKVVGAYPSWRALFEFQPPPVPRHANNLDNDWVKRTNWYKPVCVGPYELDSYRIGRYVKFKHVKDWWGDKKKYLKDRFNFDRINIKIIRDDKSVLRYFLKKDLTFYTPLSAREWATELDFDAIKKGWIVKRKIFVKNPEGLFGIIMNYKEPLFQNVNTRKALQHLFDFDKINKNLMYGSYFRMNSFFGGTQYEKLDLASYPYDPQKAAEYLKKAGWIKRGDDGILVNDKGERCSFTLTIGQDLTRHLNVYVEDLKRAGVEMKIRLVDGAKAFKDSLEKNYQAMLASMSGSIYPVPEQYLDSSFAKTLNNNNFASFANDEVDKLIKIYNTSLDFKERLTATQRIDEIVKEEAFYIPFWRAPFVRGLFWNNMGHPDDYEPLYASQINDAMTYWFDPDQDAVLQEAVNNNQAIQNVNDVINIDPHGLFPSKGVQ